tara:strand:- start:314 stop:520 length:207 start_codon:yes stop_codon:yes gene_type:complete
LYSASQEAAKKQKEVHLSLIKFFKLKHRRRIQSPHLFSSSSSLYINLLSAEQNAEILISEKKKTSVAE